jgi:hypothetical protein
VGSGDDDGRKRLRRKNLPSPRRHRQRDGDDTARRGDEPAEALTVPLRGGPSPQTAGERDGARFARGSFSAKAGEVRPRRRSALVADAAAAVREGGLRAFPAAGFQPAAQAAAPLLADCADAIEQSAEADFVSLLLRIYPPATPDPPRVSILESHHK